MKKIFALMLMLPAVLVFGCQEKKEEKAPIVYAPAQPPVASQIDELQRAVKAAPRNTEAWIALGNTFMDSQRFGEAVDAYEKALALDPKNVNVLVDQGTCYRGIGKFDKAIEQYRKALKIDPNFPNAHRNLGVVLAFDLHRNKEGLPEFKRYLELMPNAPDADTVKRSIEELSKEK